jgi:hypothetical protein
MVFRSTQFVERVRGTSPVTARFYARGGSTIWLHGASTGALPRSCRRRATWAMLLNPFTPRLTAPGSIRSAGPDPDARTASLVPWDTHGCGRARAAADRTELGPRQVFEAYSRSIPVFKVSARIYPAALPRYKAVRHFLGPTLPRITRILAPDQQDQDDALRERFFEIGEEDRCLTAAT